MHEHNRRKRTQLKYSNVGPILVVRFHVINEFPIGLSKTAILCFIFDVIHVICLIQCENGNLLEHLPEMKHREKEKDINDC